MGQTDRKCLRMSTGRTSGQKAPAKLAPSNSQLRKNGRTLVKTKKMKTLIQIHIKNVTLARRGINFIVEYTYIVVIIR